MDDNKDNQEAVAEDTKINVEVKDTSTNTDNKSDEPKKQDVTETTAPETVEVREDEPTKEETPKNEKTEPVTEKTEEPEPPEPATEPINESVKGGVDAPVPDEDTHNKELEPDNKETEELKQPPEETTDPEANNDEAGEEKTIDAGPKETSEEKPVMPVGSDIAPPAEVGVAASQMGGNHPHRNNKKLAMVVTIVVALLLSGTAVYVYLSTSSNTEEASTIVSTNTNESVGDNTVTPATKGDVDSVSADVDNAINAIDQTDLNVDALSDTTLGL